MTDLQSLTSPTLPTEKRRRTVLSLEHAAYLAVGALAAALRLSHLGLPPLAEAEARQALAAFRFTQGGMQAASGGTIPALLTGNTIGFTVFGASDMVARWLPTLFGVILVLLPYGLRHRLGRGGALAAALLLALSPSAVHLSRVLDGAIVVATCGLAMAVGLIQYLDTRQLRSLYLVAAALGVGLCAGPGIYSLILGFLSFGLLLHLGERFLNRETGWSSLAVAWGSLHQEPGALRRIAGSLVATFALVATTMVLHPAGVGLTADLLGTWATRFLPGTGEQPSIYPVLLLLRYEPLVLLLGSVEAGRILVGHGEGRPWAAQSGSSFPHTPFLIYWSLAAGVLTLIAGHRTAGNLLLVVVPLALLAGQGTERAWHWMARQQRNSDAFWPRAGTAAAVAVGLLIFFYLQIAAYTEASPSSVVSMAGLTFRTTSTYLLLASVALLLMLGLSAVVWVWHGPRVVIGGGWLAALVALGLFGFQAMWGLNFTHASDPRELMIGRTTLPDIRVLVAQLELLSSKESGDQHTLPITVEAATGPVVAWYLRDFGAQTVRDSLSAPPETAAAVTLAMEDLPIGEAFRGQGFPLRAYWLLWGRGAQDLVRWLLFTEGDLPVVDREVVLWVRSQP